MRVTWPQLIGAGYSLRGDPVVGVVLIDIGLGDERVLMPDGKVEILTGRVFGREVLPTPTFDPIAYAIPDLATYLYELLGVPW